MKKTTVALFNLSIILFAVWLCGCTNDIKSSTTTSTTVKGGDNISTTTTVSGGGEDDDLSVEAVNPTFVSSLGMFQYSDKYVYGDGNKYEFSFTFDFKAANNGNWGQNSSSAVAFTVEGFGGTTFSTGQNASLIYNSEDCAVVTGLTNNSQYQVTVTATPDSTRLWSRCSVTCYIHDTSSGNVLVPEAACDQYWWGTWQSMADGKLYVVDEYQVKKYSNEKMQNGSAVTIVESSENSLTLRGEGTFTKETNRIIMKDNIPYYRKGGTDLEFNLQLVGSGVGSLINYQADSRAGGNAKVKINDKNRPSYSKTVEVSNSNTVTGICPVQGDEMEVIVQSSNNSVIVVPCGKIETNGSNVGTVPIAEEGSYILKVIGTIKDSDKTDGYLYGDNFAEYPITLSIRNISKNTCRASEIILTPKDDCLTIGGNYDKIVQTLEAGAYRNYDNLTVKCGDFDGAYIDTGIIVTLKYDEDHKWEDFVPLRFYKGIVPLTVAAGSPEHNQSAVLNGFVIYPDGNSKYFTVVDGNYKTLYVPSFKSNEDYILVFSGAFVTQTSGTEMFYSVAPADTEYKSLTKSGSSVMRFGGDNHSEDNAYRVSESFEAYLESKETDYYLISFSESDILNATAMPKSDWGGNEQHTTIPGSSAADEYTTYNGWTTGRLSSSSSNVVYRFYGYAGSTYTISWTDAACTAISGCTGRIYVSAGSTASNNSYFTPDYMPEEESGNYRCIYYEIEPTSSGYVYIKVTSFSNVNGGTFGVQVLDGDHESIDSLLDLEYVSGSGYSYWNASPLMVEGMFTDGNDSGLYYIWAIGGTEYTVIWDDCYDGTGQYTSDIKVSASTTFNDFGSTSPVTFFANQDKGYTQKQTVKRDTTGYVFFKVEPYSPSEKYSGSYAFYVKDDNGNKKYMYRYEGFETAEAINSADDVSWGMSWGTIYPNGYDIVSFPVEKGYTYHILWEDAYDGLDDTLDGDISVAVYHDGNLSNQYWSYDNGYTNAHSIRPTEDGYAYAKITCITDGGYKFGVYRGQESVTLTGVRSYNNHLSSVFNGNHIKKEDWITGNFTDEDDCVVYYFDVTKDTVNKIFSDDKYDGSGTYSGGILYSSGYIIYNPMDYNRDDMYIYNNGYNSGTCFYNYNSGRVYIKIYPSDVLGDYAFTVAGSDNKPVRLTKYTADTGSKVPKSAWTEYSLTEGSSTKIFKISAKADNFFRIYLDDGIEGSGQYTAKLKVNALSPNEDDTNGDDLTNRYSGGIWGHYRYDQIIYILVSVEGGLDSNAGTFAITALEGNDPIAVTEVLPNAIVTASMSADVEVNYNLTGEKVWTFTADGGYQSYKWYIDGVQQSTTDSSLTVDTSSWTPGTYEIEVTAMKGQINRSAVLFIKVD